MAAADRRVAADRADDTPGFERSVARWLRAYPCRWRTARGAEITAVLADLAPAGATRLDLRSGLGLLRAGWATRWREHPPPGAWFRYAVLERPIDPRHRPWIEDDLAGWTVLLRRLAVGSWVLVVVLLMQWIQTGGLADVGFLVVLPSVYLLSIALWSREARRRIVAKQLVIQPGELVTPAARLPGLVARRRIDARSWLTATLVLVGIALGSALVALAVVRRGLALARCGTACVTVDGGPVAGSNRVVVAACVLVAALVGVLLARGAVARLRRRVPVAQPYREVVPLGAHGVVRIVLLVAGLLPLAWLAPSLTFTLAAPVAVLAALVLPVLVAARRAVLRGEVAADAGVDVLRAVLGRRLCADRPVDGHMPASSWLPVGTVVPFPTDPEGPDRPAPGTAVAVPPR
jgi:hypothetical protein